MEPCTIVCVKFIHETCFYAQVKVQPGNKDKENAYEFVISGNWKESGLRGLYDVGVKDETVNSARGNSEVTFE